MRLYRPVLAIASLVALASCDLTLSTFVVPAQVGSGELFAIDVTAYGQGTIDQVGAILQLPLGFAVEAATAFLYQQGVGVYTIPNGGLQPTTPTLVAPEPGHYVVGFAGSAPGPGLYANYSGLKVYLRAPTTPGTFQVKIALFDTRGVQPAGTTSFATITAAPWAQPVTVLSQAVLPFHAQLLATASPAPTSSDGVAIGDVDGDGLGDLACFASGPGLPRGPRVWQNRPGTNWSPSHPPATAFGIAGKANVAFGDFDGDGHRDLVESSGRVMYGDGGFSWTPGPWLPLIAREWAGVAVGDVDGDGRDDFALSASTSDVVRVFRSGPNRTFADWSGNLPWLGQAGSHRLALADIDGDGNCDLVAAGTSGVRAWLGNGLGVWTDASPGYYWTEFALGDLDADGRIDLVFASGPYLVAAEYVGGVWQQRVLPVVGGTLSGPLVVLDYDRDGWLDVCAGATLLQNLGGLSFGPPIVLLTNHASAPLQGIATGDLDGDTWPDLAVTYDGLPPVLFYNTGSGLSSYGSSCDAQGFTTPHTVGIGQPTLGNANFAIGLDGAAPNGLGLLWLGLDNHFAFGIAQLPFDLARFGAPGCAVVASTEAPVFVLADAQGHAFLPLPIPNTTALQRVVLFAQGAAAAPGANALGWLFANGLAVKIP